jgi:hypothetical protein
VGITLGSKCDVYKASNVKKGNGSAACLHNYDVGKLKHPFTHYLGEDVQNFSMNNRRNKNYAKCKNSVQIHLYVSYKCFIITIV